ncbi:valine N-monooxygenase 1-like [Cynara cardunculus var. scolymus]|uniref:valine N-monooxygenase 1-like n=1 Tax=Cynara cardunculus var. scolymus TaxID=59895 RepID=UPI000D626867|nr:valine N-monooxygenase 1-like [Cynara cardunculus var. scolymus]
MIIFVLFVVSSFIFLFTRYTRSQTRPPLPPGPKPLPLIGSIITMLQNKPTFRWIHRMMDEMGTKILCIRLGNTHVIAVSDPKIAREFLKEKDEIFSLRPDCMSGYMASGGYLTTVLVPASDQHWKKMRKMLATEFLSLSRHKWLKSKRDEEADNLLRYIYNQCEINSNVTRGVMNVRTIVQQYSSNTIRKIIFGSRYFGKGSPDGGPGQEEIEHVDSLLVILSYLYAFCVTDYFPLLRWITDFDGHERIVRKAVCTVRKLQDHLIDERIQQWKDGIRTNEDDLLDVFINLKTPILTRDQIKAQILEMILAAVDNPSNGIEWAIAEMINQPRIFDRAIHELDSMVGRNRWVQESDIPNLNYIKACAKEAYRLHPVAPFNLPHVASVDTTVAGYFIPKGSNVLLSRIGLGRNPDVWDDPLTFNPDRHMVGDDEVVLTDYSLQMISFSTGRRGCAGVLLGSTMTVMLLARMVQGFTWELPPNEPYVDLKENHQDIMKAKPLLALVKPRLPHHLYPIS